MGQLSTKAQNVVASQSTAAAGELTNVANALRQTSKQLDGNSVAPFVEKAAAHVERVSEYVRNADIREIKLGVEKFARNEPLLFIGGAFALGMVAARFLKASAAHITEENIRETHH